MESETIIKIDNDIKKLMIKNIKQKMKSLDNPHSINQVRQLLSTDKDCLQDSCDFYQKINQYNKELNSLKYMRNILSVKLQEINIQKEITNKNYPSTKLQNKLSKIKFKEALDTEHNIQKILQFVISEKKILNILSNIIKYLFFSIKNGSNQINFKKN